MEGGIYPGLKITSGMIPDCDWRHILYLAHIFSMPAALDTHSQLERGT
jgi:hypothetical protein